MNFLKISIMNKDDTSWYEKIEYSEGMAIEQGDILFDCPYYDVLSDGINEEIQAKVVEYNVVIVTQSCDIANNKVDKIFVAPWIYISEAISKRSESSKGPMSKKEKKSFFKHLADGVMPSHHILDKDIEKGLEDYPVIDFSNAFTISQKTLKSTIAKRCYVIRLISPYKEHLSQAFARFFMRVGLPSSLTNPY